MNKNKYIISIIFLCQVQFGFAQKNADAELTYMAFFQDLGESDYINSPNLVGVGCQNRRIEGFTIKSNKNIRYKAVFERIGETEWFNVGEYCGSKENKDALLAFWVELQGEDANKYDILYRADLQGTGMTNLIKNGQKCGENKEHRRRIRGFSIEIRTK